MADEHTRKFNDWHIVKPKRKVCVPSSEGVAASGQVHSSGEQINSTLARENNDIPEGNPFAASLNEESPSMGHSSHQAATAPFIPEVSEDHSPEKEEEEASVANQHADTETLIDPDTGLEIPKYMQPFINRSN